MKLSAAIRSMRLRTLPLSLSGVVCGGLMALADGAGTSAWTIVFLILTTACLQILSNMSNELGDYRSGTDNEVRQGPTYSVAGGEMTEHDLLLLIRIFVVLCGVCGGAMVAFSFGSFASIEPWLLILLGAAAIWAAIHYTLGSNPYGYRGWGDLFVFLFFGLVSVMGSYYVVAHRMAWPLLLPAAAIGFFSIGVLNVNNIRDMASDAGTRVTVPLKLGERRAKKYHTLLILSGWLCLIGYSLLSPARCHGWSYLYLLTLPLYALHLRGVWQRTGRALDPMLPLLVMSTFLLAILFAAGQLITA